MKLYSTFISQISLQYSMIAFQNSLYSCWLLILMIIPFQSINDFKDPKPLLLLPTCTLPLHTTCHSLTYAAKINDTIPL